MITLVIVVAFLFLAALNGLLITAGRHWMVKCLLIALTPIIVFTVWWAISQQTGWPTNSRAPNGTIFISGVVRAPTPGDAGEIDIWGEPPHSNRPRAYKYPYSPPLEQRVAKAAQKAKHGEVAMRNPPKGNGTLRHGRSRPQSDRYKSPQFYPLPPAGVQEKSGPA